MDKLHCWGGLIGTDIDRWGIQYLRSPAGSDLPGHLSRASLGQAHPGKANHCSGMEQPRMGQVIECVYEVWGGSRF